APGHPAYVIAGAARLRGGLDVPRLRQALATLVARHPSLRATFPADGEAVAQAVRAEADFTFVEEDAAAAGEAELADRLAAAAYGPFDLARGPLLRVTVLHRGAAAPLLVLAVHHIVADFWSLGVLLRELGALWREEALPLPPLDDGDFVRRESERLAGAEGERLWNYWRAELASPVPALDLPADRPRPPRPSLCGGSRTLRLPADLAARLAARARRAGATPFMAHLAAFFVLLHRLTDQEELRVGTPTAGRGSPDLAGVVGYFVNPVAVRGDLRGDPSFGALLDRVKAAAVAALAHQGLPFPLLAERLGGERDPSRSPLFQAMFVLYRERLPAERGLGGFAVGAAGSTLDLGGLVLESLPLPRQSSQFDLTLLLAETGDHLVATLQFSRDLFDDTTAERWLAHAFQTLLVAMGDAGDAGDTDGVPVSALPLLAASECHQLAIEWNAAPWEVNSEDLVQTPFERQAARTPEAIAVVDGAERAISYGELDRRASLLARALVARGVGAEQIVGIFGEPSLALIAGLFAVLKAGGAYLPLDPTQPDERLAQLLADAGAAVVLADERLAGRLPATVRRLPLDDCPARPADGAYLHPQSADTAAYLLYTSGSTGKPKGVVVPHRAVVNRLRFQVAADLTAGARVLQRTRLGFDVSVVEVFAPLWMGASVVLTTPEGQQDPVYLGRRIAEQQITNLNLPPALFPALLADPALRGAASLRRVVTGADRVPGDLPQSFFAAFGSGPQAPRLIARYGPTEATISVSEQDCRPEPSSQNPQNVPLGRPLAGTRFHLLDRHQRPVSLGVPGELCIAGVCLARGYLARPDATAAAFLPDPFARSAAAVGERLYRTGDLARYRADGVVEFLGRIDRQVKIRGFRLEPGEVEAALCRHPEVVEAAVVDQDEPATGGKRLVAYVVAGPGANVVDPAGLAGRCRDFLAGRLPAYMIPAAFVLLPRLPWNANGKLDRAALPAPEWQPPGAPGESRQAPRTPVEEILAGLWAELFGRERVGVDDDFFALGGHSLLGTRLISRLRAAFGIELPLGTLFAAPRLADFASRVEAALQAGGAGAVGGIPPLVALPRGGPLPLSFAQQRLWFLALLEPGSPLYNLAGALHVEGPLDGSVLALCLAEIVRRHEALRTVFAARDGAPVQVIRPPSSFVLPVVDLSGLAERTRAALAEALTAGEAVRPFDLAHGPLLRGLLLRLAAGESADHLAALTLHHIASDGWSLDVFVREIAAFYAAFVAGRPSPLPELPVQYADFAVWQRSWLTGEVLEGEIAFWRRQLAGLPPLLDLPTDRPRSAAQSFRGASRPVRLPAGLTRQVQALARRSGATLFMVLLAGFQGLLARWSGQEDFAVGAPVAGRTHREIEPLIGFFVNTLVLRGDLSGTPSFYQLLGRVRETALSAYRHQDVPFDKLVEELAAERSLARTPLIQVLLALQNAPGLSLEIGDLRLRLLRVETRTAKFDLTVHLAEQDGALAGRVEYTTDLFDRTTVDRLIAGYERLVAGAVAEEDRPLVDLPLLSAAELHQIRSEWNPAPAPPGAALVERFESWAERTPDAIAVLAPAEALTYSELDVRADRLARRLRSLGVTLDARIGLCAERSPAMILAVLGIQKAGAAYVPLDPEYPRERLAFMVEDARLLLLITEERLLGRLPETAVATLLLDAGGSGIDGRSAARLPGRLPKTATAGSLAYVIYTSGSTGRPKGVMVHHRGWSHLAEAQRHLLGLGPGDRVLQFASLSFDASAWEISLAFGAGATLLLGPRERRLSREELTAVLRESTAALVPPSVLATLSPADLSGPPILIVAGEACPVELARAWASGRRLWNAYGPTEATVCATVKLYDHGDRLPIGRPIDGMQAWVLDRRGNPAPVGAVGELCLAGPGLARGYSGQPALTAQSFVPHPLATLPGERLYRTGDLALRRPDGSLELRGRLDHQVKIRGWRVELGEIEAALTTLPGVRAAVVVARESAPGGRQLVAYVVGDAADAGDAGNIGDMGDDVLRRALRERLPDPMVPAAFVVLPALPLTPNGKLDRAALPAPESAA
ncbi:MAG TPA: amino acid adenylation domain-containing protein, partial [Thermoanaerobaculia bacterium]|nr:amino acid adenylation domain-containing protein [Thermoanaerobaculia bacterium]